MDVPPPEAGDPLAQPTRARLFARLRDLRRAASTEELASDLRVHPNSVRHHMAQLLEAGLVERRVGAGGRGRPGYQWAIAPGARPAGRSPRGYGELARWLARMIGETEAEQSQAESEGRRIGHEIAPRGPSTEPAAALGTALSALGFEPEQRIARGRLLYRLGNCPYRDAVRQNQSVVCALHKGIAEGLLDRIAPEGLLTGFEPKDPQRAGCLIEVELPQSN
jgi:predicted ArsR family transcriptional regulator